MNFRFGTLFIAAVTSFAEGGRVNICHVPPGNPDNVQLLTVNENALSGHDGHSDYFPGDRYNCAATDDDCAPLSEPCQGLGVCSDACQGLFGCATGSGSVLGGTCECVEGAASCDAGASCEADSDGDGVGDSCDSCPHDADNDVDGDGVCGNHDLCATTDPCEQTCTDSGDSYTCTCAAGFTLSADGHSCIPCDVEADGFCYTVHDDRSNWADARASCAALGGDAAAELASIHSDDVQHALYNLCGAVPTEERCWIGLNTFSFGDSVQFETQPSVSLGETDSEENGVRWYGWSNGANVEYVRNNPVWHTLEPNNYRDLPEECTEIRSYEGWNDRECHRLRFRVCGTDVNECEVDNGGCAGGCENTLGGFRCV